MSTSSEQRALIARARQCDAQLHFDFAQQRLVAMRHGHVRHHGFKLAFERREVRESAKDTVGERGERFVGIRRQVQRDRKSPRLGHAVVETGHGVRDGLQRREHFSVHELRAP